MEKRKEIRVSKRILSSLEDKPAIIIDISLSGFKISMNRPPRNQEVEVKMQVGGKVISLKGDVRWIASTASSRGAKQIGIAIREAPDEYYQMFSVPG